MSLRGPEKLFELKKKMCRKPAAAFKNRTLDVQLCLEPCTKCSLMRTHKSKVITSISTCKQHLEKDSFHSK